LVNPSGAQWEIRRGDQHAVVVEVGGGLREYVAGRTPVLDGYAANEMCSGGRGQPLVPWPNRLADGLYTFGGRSLQLPITEVAKHNAIHGLVRWASWSLISLLADRVRVGFVLHPQPGYPFALGLEIEYRLENSGLIVSLTAVNLGGEPLPYAAGHHPYITAGEAVIDTARVRVPAARAVVVDQRQLPTGDIDVVSAGLDFRETRVLGPTRLDTAFTDLERDAEGRAWVEMFAGGSDRAVRVWMDSSYTHVMLFTGDSLEDESRRRRGLGVEPMTCAPNAFASGLGVLTLAPGASHSSAWGIAPG
jgi:aldose 1-epimerase